MKDKTFLLQMGLMSLVLVDDGTHQARAARAESDAAFRGVSYGQWLRDKQNRPVDLEGNVNDRY